MSEPKKRILICAHSSHIEDGENILSREVGDVDGVGKEQQHVISYPDLKTRQGGELCVVERIEGVVKVLYCRSGCFHFFAPECRVHLQGFVAFIAELVSGVV
jgi:hypothetical protein